MKLRYESTHLFGNLSSRIIGMKQEVRDDYLRVPKHSGELTFLSVTFCSFTSIQKVTVWFKPALRFLSGWSSACSPLWLLSGLEGFLPPPKNR